MAEGQGDIEAITLMKTNEGQTWREMWKENEVGKKRQTKKKGNKELCVCVYERDRLLWLRIIKHNIAL